MLRWFCLWGIPLPSCRFASSHTPPFVAMRHLPPERGKSSLKGTALAVAENFTAAPKGAPLGELSRSD